MMKVIEGHVWKIKLWNHEKNKKIREENEYKIGKIKKTKEMKGKEIKFL